MSQNTTVAPAISEISVPETVHKHSHTKYHIGGLPVHVYGIEEATKSFESVSSSSFSSHDELVVFNLIHPRTRSYEYTSQMAHLILDAYYQELTKNENEKDGLSIPPAVVATFDLRNHGHRIVDEGNADWKRGNPKHGQDMVSGIMGSVQDVEFVMDLLPAYLPQVLTTTTTVKDTIQQIPKKIWNIVSGVSQGGHIAWKVAAHADPSNPDTKKWNLLAAIPFIGCPDITTMLVHRMLNQICRLSRDDARELLETKVLSDPALPYKSAAFFTYSQLAARLEAAGVEDIFSKVFPTYWPQQLHDLVSAEDRKTYETVKQNIGNVLVINSKEDPLVPSWITYEFAEKYPSTLTGNLKQEKPFDKTLVEIDGIGHVTTNEMLDMAVEYAIKVIQNRQVYGKK